MSIDGVDDELRPKCCPVNGGQEHRRHPKRKSRNGELDVRVRSYPQNFISSTDSSKGGPTESRSNPDAGSVIEDLFIF
jgi:hypothetical protein